LESNAVMIAGQAKQRANPAPSGQVSTPSAHALGWVTLAPHCLPEGRGAVQVCSQRTLRFAPALTRAPHFRAAQLTWRKIDPLGKPSQPSTD